MSGTKKLFSTNNPIIIVEEISQVSDYNIKLNRTVEDTNVKATDNADDISANTSEKHECDECEYSSHNKHYLKQHVELVHNSERRYKCPYCDYAGKRTHSLKEHLVVHSNERPFSCHHCNATFRKKGHLTNHVKLHSSVRSSRCFICHEQFPENSSLDQHLRDVHKTKKVFMCALCSFYTAEHSNIVNHLESHHKWENLNFYMINEVLKCIECSFFCHDSNEMIEHTKLHCEKESNTINDNLNIKCSECGFISNDSVTVKEHMWQHLNSSGNFNVETKEHQLLSSSSADHASPILSSSSSKQDISSQCDSSLKKSLKVKDRLKSHIKEMASIGHLKGQPPTCLVNMQSPVNKYTCSICGYSCVNQRTFKTHIWKHSGHKDIDYPIFQNNSGNVSGKVPLLPVNTNSNEMSQSHSTDKPSSQQHENCVQNENVNASNSESSSLIQLLKSPAFQARVKIVKTKDLKQDLPATSLSSDLTPSHKQSPQIILNTSLNLQSTCHSESQPPKDLHQTKDTDTSNTDGVTDELSSKSTNTECIVKQVAMDPSCSNNVLSNQNPYLNEHELIENRESEKQILPDPPVIPKDYSPMNLGDIENETLKTNNSNVFDGNIAETPAGDSALTLLSLLKKGPNYNPACPFGAEEIIASDMCVSATVTISDSSVESSTETDSVTSHPSKPKSGISSSLLAVIEQLRERSKSETDGHDFANVAALSNLSTNQQTDKNEEEDKTSLIYLDNVEQFRYGGELRYRCKFCHYSNSSNFVMLQHMRLHKIKQPFECSLCEFVAKSSGDLQDHMIQHCKIRTYQCKVCPSVFNYKSQLRAHMRAHNDQDPYTCEVCSFETSSSLHFSNHMRKHSLKDDKSSEKRKRLKKDSNDSEECVQMSNKMATKNGKIEEPLKIQGQTLKCSDCDFTCSSTAAFKVHAEKHLLTTESLQCQFCDFAAVSTRSLKSHMKRHINDQRYVQQPLEQYKCNLCGYVCHHLPSLKSHMWRHASNIDYSYEYTNEIINAAIDYDTQLENESLNDSVPQTGQSQTSQQGSKDSRDGTEKKSTERSCADKLCLVTFRCCQCGYETIFKPDLNKHMKMHSDIIQQTLDVSKCLEPVVFSQEVDISP